MTRLHWVKGARIVRPHRATLNQDVIFLVKSVNDETGALPRKRVRSSANFVCVRDWLGCVIFKHSPVVQQDGRSAAGCPNGSVHRGGNAVMDRDAELDLECRNQRRSL